MVHVEPKFETKYLSEKPPDDPTIPGVIKLLGRADGLGFAPSYTHGDRDQCIGSFGNAWWRSKDGTDIVTASGTHFGNMEPDCFVTLEDFRYFPEDRMNRAYVHGTKKATSEAGIYFAVSRLHPEAMGAIHGHYAKLTEAEKELGADELRRMLNLDIRVTEREEPYGIPVFTRLVLHAMGVDPFSNGDSCIVQAKNHGVFVFSGDERGILAAGDKMLQLYDVCEKML